MAYKDPHDERLKAARRKHYEQNKDAYKARARQRERDMLEWCWQVKDRPCMDCGNSYSPWVMEFDHRNPEDKSGNINQIIQKGNWDTLKQEIEKCDVVCANCHRERTAKMFGWKLDKAPLSVL